MPTSLRRSLRLSPAYSEPAIALAARGGEAGQGTVELALVLPVLLIVLLGVLQFGLVYHARTVVVIAAQEGARFAAAEERTVAEGVERARSVLQSGLGRTGMGLNVGGWTTAETVAVEIGGNYPLIIPWVSNQGIPLDATVEIRKEGFRSGP